MTGPPAVSRSGGPAPAHGAGAPGRDGMPSIAVRLDALDDDACFLLLATVRFGRVVATSGALPLVVPVNFALDGRVIVFRTAADGPLAAATRGVVVAFQADAIDPIARTGWSVAVTGVAHSVTHAGLALRMAQLGIDPWAPGPRDTYVRIAPGLVTGRYLTAPERP